MSLFLFIKSALSILDVVRTYVPLKPLGAYWKASCPFHSEKDASFTVSPDKGIFYCFGCHASGDLIGFVARYEQMSQLDAARHLIEQYSIVVPEHLNNQLGSGQGTDHVHKERYFAFCSLLEQWCIGQLEHSATTRDYLMARGLTKESIKQFGIGYFASSPSAVKQLLGLMSTKGFLVADGIQFGLLVEKQGMLSSPFQDRLMFPIYDALGRCCGFGGRVILPNDTRPKYYNSKESDAFVKNRLLFGFDKAKKSIQTKGYACLVEGYMDCIAMVQHGFTNTVATLGTACSIEHLRMISRHASRLMVVYDGDQAGQKAMVRLAELCWQVDLELYVVTLPDGKDPAALLTSGVDLQPYLEQAQDIFRFFVGRTSQEFEKKSLSEKLVAARKIVSLLSHIQDPIKRSVLLSQASAALDVPKDALEEGALAHTSDQHQWSRSTTVSQPQQMVVQAAQSDAQNQVTVLEEKIFCAILADALGKKTSIPNSVLTQLFSDRLVRLCTALQNFTMAHGHSSDTGTVAQFLDFVEQDDREWVIRVSMEHTQASQADMLDQLLTMLARYTWKITASKLKERLLQAQHQQDTDSVHVLMRQFASLKQEMHTRGIL